MKKRTEYRYRMVEVYVDNVVEYSKRKKRKMLGIK